MILLASLAIGVLTAAGVYLLLRPRTFPVIVGLSLLSHAVNLFIFAAGGLTTGAPVVLDGPQPEYADPLPQALVLTAIVIALGMTAFTVVLALRAQAELGSDRVDAQGPPE